MEGRIRERTWTQTRTEGREYTVTEGHVNTDQEGHIPGQTEGHIHCGRMIIGTDGETRTRILRAKAHAIAARMGWGRGHSRWETVGRRGRERGERGGGSPAILSFSPP